MSTRWSFVIGLGAVVFVAASTSSGRVTSHTFHHDNVLGTSLDLTILATSDAAARTAEAAVLEQIDRDEKILSAYDATSEFSRWFQTQDRPETVSPELFEILAQFDTWRDRTGGALDASAEHISRLWRAAASTGQVPSDAALAAAVATSRATHWRLDPVARTATHLTATPLVLHSFTKSYIVDRAARAAMGSGSVRAAVVNIGGDIVVRGDWTETVGVTDPRHTADNSAPMATLAIRDRAVATSGGYRRGVEIGGRHYSHIVDPRTGRPTGHVLSATVVSDDAVNAGALATALCVLPPEEGQALAARVAGTEYLLVLADGRRIESPGWRRIAAPASRPALVSGPVATLHAAGQTWHTDFELAIALDIARPGGRARRPYVAVWIEDKDAMLVRTIALWYEKPRWLPDLRAWSRADRRRAGGAARGSGARERRSASSATRPPGRYSLVWDGKDDLGALVAPGSYTVFIEAAREHGTHQLMQQAMEFTGVPKRVELPGNVEIAGVTLDYRKIAGR
jgi:FAD:protein FMN transferase